VNDSAPGPPAWRAAPAEGSGTLALFFVLAYAARLPSR